MKQKIVGIDLGSSNIIIYIPNKGIIFNEPNIIAFNDYQNKVIAIGYLALKMLGKEPENVHVIRPVNDGVVSSITMQTNLIKQILIDKKMKNLLKKSKLIISSPSVINEVNTFALKKIAKNFDVSEVDIKSQSYLALLGCDSTSTSTRGNLLITIGGGCSDITVSSGTKILFAKTSSFSGKKIDEAISRLLRKKHHLIIGDKTCEYIKMKIGSLEQFPENRLLEVSGRDLVTSLPNSIILSTIEVKEAIKNPVQILIDSITDCLEVTPPEVASDIIESGIIICGGGSLLGGIREYLENNLNITVRILSDPTYAVINGIKNYSHIINK